MGRVFFTSDHHFGHAAMISPTIQRPRPFSSIEEMDEHLVQCWNAVVRPGDQVHHLGDFAYKAKPERVAKIFRRLNGEKHLTIGNHDRPHVLALPWASPPKKWRQIAVDGQRLFLCHYAFRTWPGIHRGVVHLYGHSHGSLPGTRQSLDVGVDAFNFMPQTIDGIRHALSENADIEGVARPDDHIDFEDAAGHDGP